MFVVPRIGMWVEILGGDTMKQEKTPLRLVKENSLEPTGYEVIDWTEYLRIPQGKIDWKALASIVTVFFQRREPQERKYSGRHLSQGHGC